MLRTSKTLVHVIVYVRFFFVCCEKRRKMPKKKIKVPEKKSTAKRKWKETVSYDCVS